MSDSTGSPTTPPPPTTPPGSGEDTDELSSPLTTTAASDDEDQPELSAGTMAALLEFYREEEERRERVRQVEEAGDLPHSFDEIWNLSQFWYSEETAHLLAQECVRAASTTPDRPRSPQRPMTPGSPGDPGSLGSPGSPEHPMSPECPGSPGGAIACVSTPTLYRALTTIDHNCTVRLLEYDTRFSVFRDDFVFYDYRHPLRLPRHLQETFDVVVADPPYLSDDCLTKTALTITYLARPGAKIILCSGLVVEGLADRLLGLSRCHFEVRHHNNLSNPFVCYANYDLDTHCYR